MSVEEFESGAVRDSQDGKIKYELITPTFKRDIAKMLTDKAKHYGDRNWEKGIPTARTFSSLLRHVEALGRGEWLDEESGHPHTVLAAANLMFIHEFHDTQFDTLQELVGPALRVLDLPAPGGWVDESAELAMGSALLSCGAPEPPRDTVWRDKQGDIWSYKDGGWGWVCGRDDHDHGVDCADPWWGPWRELKEEDEIWPLVRVS